MDLSNFDIVWVNSCTYFNGIKIKKHIHNFFHFIYIVTGIGCITIGETEYTFNPGNIYLVSPFVEHTFFNSDKSPLKTIEIKFCLNDEKTENVIKNLSSCLNVKKYPIKTILLTIYEELLDEKSLSSEIVDLNFRLFLTYLLRCHVNLQENLIHGGNNNPEMKKVIDYICNNLGEDLSLENLANIAGYEKNYFLRRFKEIYKQTPISFVRNKRIETAKELLRYSDMNIAQIAAATGFNSIHYFSKIFFEYTGIRPTNYRDEIHR